VESINITNEGNNWPDIRWQATAQRTEKNMTPVSHPSQAGVKGYIIQIFVAKAIHGAPDA
jgi:hypothetical protein